VNVLPGAEDIERKNHEDNSSTGDIRSKGYMTDISDWANLVIWRTLCVNRKGAWKVFYGQAIT